jgi:lipid-binding SYLF domain-containing protein
MKRLNFILTVFIVLLISLSPRSFAGEDEDYLEAIKIFRESNVSREFFNNCYGYAIFPSIGKGGFLIGGSYGNGKVFRQGEFTGRVTLIEGSIGFQAGGKKFSEIIFFEDKRAYDEFTSGAFEFDATAQAVAINKDVDAQASAYAGGSAGISKNSTTLVQAETTYYKGMAVFVHSRGGLMVEASLGGQKFKFKPLIKP